MPLKSDISDVADFAPALLRVQTKQLGTMVRRASPHHTEGQWATPEHALCGAVVALWLADVVDLARKQLTDTGRLWMSPGAAWLLNEERPLIWLDMIGVHQDWLSQMLEVLGLSFGAIERTGAIDRIPGGRAP